ncbi:MAG TPA: EndoU domain-containing protein [Pseudogracilibacillus sp.]|nr:EndoU domain-containing protein [Pseudogracilibacillus sp.]
MHYKTLKVIMIGIVFFISACMMMDNEENSTDNRQTDVTTIHQLERTEHFREGALAHILEGELNHKGQAVGFHYDQLPTKKGEVIEGTETKPDEFGVYEAKVTVSDIEKKSNGGKSTFFPDEWDTQEIVDVINEAYEKRVFITGNTYEGLTAEGMVIRIYVDQQQKIISAFPIYEGS